MTAGVSLKLKAAMKEMSKVAEKHDVAAAIFLADGLGNGEFLFNFDKPSWSMMRFIDRPDGSLAVHTKLHCKSKPDETNRTVNVVLLSLEMIGRVWLMMKELGDQFESQIKIERGVVRSFRGIRYERHQPARAAFVRADQSSKRGKGSAHHAA